MSKRKTISKKTRFEVFKRDNFTCQYCGGKSPEVVLHIDHIAPVAGGGGNDIMNLITSCEPCNLGKGARELNDNSAIAKQRVQLEHLNERREQLEMLLAWREGLASLTDAEVDAINHVFNARTRQTLNDYGRSEAARFLKKFPVAEVITALEAALETYYKGGSDDEEENRYIAGQAFIKTERILQFQKRNADKPYMRDLFYLRGIIRKRHYCNDVKAIALLEEAYLIGVHLDDLRELSTTSRSWTAWHRTLADWIEDEKGGGQ